MASTTGDWMIEQHLCRCCHSEGKFKSLISTDPLMEDELLYLDALRFCLDIELCLVEGSLAYAACTICETCVSRLQEACSFRRQVLSCERRFQTMYSQNHIKVASSEPVVKKELSKQDVASLELVLKEELSDPDDSLQEDNYDRDTDSPCIKVEDLATKIPKKESVDLLDLLDSSQITVKRKSNLKLKVPPKKIVKKKEVVPKPSASKPAATKQAEKKKEKLEEDRKTPKPRGSKKRGDIQREPKKISYQLCDSDYERTGDKFKCTRCNRILHSTPAIRRHIKTYHLLMYTFNCTLCDKSFNSIVPFVKHKLDEHNIDDRFKCNACDKVFNTKPQLNSHRNNFHKLGKRMKCPQCDYECYSTQVMNKHRYKHKTVKDHHCKYCKKSFLRLSTLNFHERIHTGDRRKVCAECGQAFVQKASLNYHMMKYHPEVNY